MAFDIDEIKALRSLVDVVGERVKLKANGKEYRGLCPFHSEKTPSFDVVPENGFWHCKGCGQGGDIIDFVMLADGVDFKGACEILGGKRKTGTKIATKKAVKKIFKSCYDGIEPIIPVPSHAPLFIKNKKTPPIWNPKRDEDGVWRESTYRPEMVFEYTTAEGKLLGYVLRVVIADKKLTPTIMWVKRKDKEGNHIEQWCHYSFPEPRPLYGLAGLYLNPDAPVLIVEGEKCVDAAHRLLPKYNVVSWPGGGKVFSRADWSPMKGKKVTLWPDADQEGADTMDLLAAKMLDIGAESVQIITWDESKPKGWDVADAEAEKWSKTKLIKWAKERAKSYPEPKPEAEQSGEEMPPIEDGPPPEAYDMDSENQASPEPPNKDDHAPPFKALGHKDNYFYYLPDMTQQVVKLSPQAHTKNNMMLLAPLKYWSSHFGARTKDGVDWENAFESLLRLQNRAGIFDEHNKIRGRGAWLDAGRTVLHLGSHVYVDGEPFEPQKVDSKYIYPRDIDLDIDASKPATTKESRALMDICQRLSWQNELSGRLLAGWLVIAPVCGMLKWRPHLWITGAAGTGKSTILDTIVKKVLGPTGQLFSKNTTEAAIRQHLGRDALPIAIDEFEAEDKKAVTIVQGILNLARLASSGGIVLKGTADGTGQAFCVRACFLFGSINTSIYHKADEDRISTLILKPIKRTDDEDKRWQALLGDILATCTNEYANKMLARTLDNLKVLQTNCNTFTEAVAVVLKSRRVADQMGTLLAGAHLCHNTKEIPLAEAVEWVKKQGWTEHTTIEAKGDEERLLDRLATSRIRFNASNGPKETSLGELIIIASNILVNSDDIINTADAIRELKLYGILVKDEELNDISKAYVYISNDSGPIRKLLAETPWAGEWGRPLRDLEGAEATKTKHFSSGIKSRATKLPLSLFLE